MRFTFLTIAELCIHIFCEADAQVHGTLLNKGKQHTNIIYLTKRTKGKHTVYIKKTNMNNFALIVRLTHETMTGYVLTYERNTNIHFVYT